MHHRSMLFAALIALAGTAPAWAESESTFAFDPEAGEGGFAALIDANRQAAAEPAPDCVRAPAASQSDNLVTVGEEVAVAIENVEFTGGRGVQLAWRQEIYDAGATYIAPHFRHFNLPEGASLIVRAPDDSRSWTYEGEGKPRFPGREGFWGIHIAGDSAIIEIYSNVPLGRGRVTLDSYARGFKPEQTKAQAALGTKAICGSDDSQWAQCYSSSEPTIYQRGHAVARLLIQGTSACTGWLVGDAGDLITNNHCISTASAANNTDYEFDAEGSCSQNCASWFACPGTVAATSGSMTKTSSPLDYTLIRLSGNPQSTYGYLQMRNAGATVNERIYIPGHPAGWGKRFSVASTASSDQSGKCEVASLSAPACSGGANDVGYPCDTQGGSSGSPVLGYADHAVVALHHCGTCDNRGVPIQSVIADLGTSLPPNSTTGAPPPPPTCGLPGASCSVSSDCCSNSCKGKPGKKTCR